jgi:hypothetical protein
MTNTFNVRSALLTARQTLYVAGLLWSGLLVGLAQETNTVLRQYPLMHFTVEQRRQMMLDHLRSPQVSRDKSFPKDFASSMSLLSRLPYVPAERDQVNCGDCWQWAGTGVMEIAHDMQNGIHDRLSVQFINSCNTAINCCDGGWLESLAAFYSSKSFAIPWSNDNAQFRSGSGSCSSAACGSIATTPRYAIAGISSVSITTHGVGQAQAIDNIKNVLNQNKAVSFEFYMDTDADWVQFGTFWNNQSEGVLWSDFFCGQIYDDGSGGGHAVLCVGYNDDNPANRYWIMVNSWGTTAGRPNGIFHVSMDLNYDCADNLGPNLYWKTLDVQFVAPLTANDQCAGAITIGSSSYTQAQSTTSATSTGDPLPSCVSAFGNGVWYKYTPPSNGQIVVDTIGSDFDTGLAFFTGTCGSLTQVACDDNAGSNSTSALTNSVAVGTTYYILAGGRNGLVGNLVLHLAFAPAPAGVDHFLWNTIVSPQQVGNQFAVTVTAQDAANVTVNTFSGMVALSGSAGGASANVSLSPTVSGSFVNGVWAGVMTVLETAANVVLKAADGSGHVGLSNPFTVAGAPPSSPTLIAEPQSQTVKVGADVTFTVSATGTAPLSYFWLRNGTAVAGASELSYTLNNVQVSDSGSQFSCLVSNAAGMATSQPATLTVTPPVAGFVTRQLPAGYMGGVALMVSLVCAPPAGASVYAVEDRPPAGWIPGLISDGGVFDAVSGKVKYGPFFDNTARTLTCQITPPVGATNRVCFVGTGSVDGVDSVVGGDSCLEVALTHPADSNADGQLVVNEVTAYGSAWKNGKDWPLAPNPIPIGYVTRAGALWRWGECYRYDGSQLPPLCWVSCTKDAAAEGAKGVSIASRVISGNTVFLTVVPATSVSVYAVEEGVPPGFVVSGITPVGGVFDVGGRKVKWGPFFDNAERVLSYTITPEPGASKNVTLVGTGSFDGVDVAITGQRQVSENPPALLSLDLYAGVMVTGTVGQTYRMEWSPVVSGGDWTPAATVVLTNAMQLWVDPSAPARSGSNRFYRAVLLP